MDNISVNIDSGNVNFSFQKEERLCSKKIIDELFVQGKSVFVFPVKMVYIETKLTSGYPVQAGFAVSKKSFKRAVQRNLIKRRMREAYRLNKSKFYEEIGEKQVAVFFIFTGKTILEYQQIETAVKKGIKKLLAELKADK
jgi:ribonuclease P protein component